MMTLDRLEKESNCDIDPNFYAIFWIIFQFLELQHQQRFLMTPIDKFRVSQIGSEVQ